MDDQSFSILILKHKNALLGHIKKFINDPNLADDILQESIQKAYISLDKYNNNYNFSTWLYTIARNTALDYLRKQSLPITNYEDEELIRNIPDPKHTPEQRLVFNQDYDKLVSVIENLPEPYNKIAEMRFIKEFAYEEIAQALDMPINTVRTRLRKAKELLSELIDQNEFRNSI